MTINYDIIFFRNSRELHNGNKLMVVIDKHTSKKKIAWSIILFCKKTEFASCGSVFKKQVKMR
jgi:hypothetical protein